MNLIKTIHKPGIKLIGFKDTSKLKLYFNLKHAVFLYPDESMTRGSSLLFATLLDSMLDLNKFGLAACTSRNNTQTRLVALLPQREMLDADGLQIQPAGFQMVLLPFADDIRHLQLDSVNTKVEDSQIDVAKKLIKGLLFDFSSSQYPNPVLQKHYTGLQAIALERDNAEPVPDLLVPDAERVQQQTQILEEFKEATLGEDFEAASVANKKRKAEQMSRLSELDESTLSVATLKKYTVPVLKDFCSLKGIKITSKDKKDDLLSKLQDKLGLPAGEPNEQETSKKVKKTMKNGDGKDEETTEIPKKAKKKSPSVKGEVTINENRAEPVDEPLKFIKTEEGTEDPPHNMIRCMYGDKCYRKNPQHLAEYWHPPLK